MATNAQEIQLTDEQRRTLAELAERTGRPWYEVLSDAIRSYRPSADNGGADACDRLSVTPLSPAAAAMVPCSEQRPRRRRCWLTECPARCSRWRRISTCRRGVVPGTLIRFGGDCYGLAAVASNG